MRNITFKFIWPKPAGFEPLELIIAGNDLKARDPEGKSLIAGKLRNLGSKGSTPDSPIEFSAIGPRENQIMSPTLVRFVWDYAKSGSLVCPWVLSPKECSLALDYFGFNSGEGLDIIIADDDPLKTSKLFAYCAFKNTLKTIPGIIQHVKLQLSSNHLSSGMHFIVAPPNPNSGGFMRNTLMDYYSVEHLPSGFQAIELNEQPLPGEKGYARSSFDALSPDTDNAANARNAVLAGVLAIGGGIQAEWSKRILKVCDVGGFGMHDFHSAECHVLEVQPAGNDGVAETQGILSFVSESEEDEQHGPSSKRTRHD